LPRQNFFRIAGDVCHLLSFVVMFWKLHSSKSVAGISLKTQELYVIVFVARYLDLFWNFLSIYNWVRAAPLPSRHNHAHQCQQPRLRRARSPLTSAHPPAAFPSQVMKVIFITASLSIVYIIRFGVPHRQTYNKEDDAFPTQYASSSSSQPWDLQQPGRMMTWR